MDTKAEEKSDKLEIVITVLLGLATVLGALAAYFSALWGGETQTNYAKSVATTNVANTIYLESLNEIDAFEMGDFRDDLLYGQWKDNVSRRDPDADYYFSKLSEGLQNDLKDNPSDISEYEKEQSEKLSNIQARFRESQDTLRIANDLMLKGQLANKNGDGFTLTTVMFTIVLFFLGLASLKTKASLRKTYTIFAVIVMVLSIIKLLTTPFPSL